MGCSGSISEKNDEPNRDYNHKIMGIGERHLERIDNQADIIGQRLKEEAEEKKRQIEEQESKLREEAEEKKRLLEEQERKLREEAEAKKREAEELERKLREEAEAKKREAEEQALKLKEEAEAKIKEYKAQFIDKILPSEKNSPSNNCHFLLVKGSFYSQMQKALDRVNEIREEACREGVKDPQTGKKLTMNDYKPYKWSTDLERIARVRAMEGLLCMAHERLNGEKLYSVTFNGLETWGETLAWNYTNQMIPMINQWYDEKKDWVTGGPGVTIHYELLITTRFNYIGLGLFKSTVGEFPSCLAGSFSDETNNLEQTFLPEYKDIYQTVEVLKSSKSTNFLKGSNTVQVGSTAEITPRVKLEVKKGFELWPYELKDLTFSSSNTSVATIDCFGTLKGVGQGNAKITCKNGSTVFAELNVTVS